MNKGNVLPIILIAIIVIAGLLFVFQQQLTRFAFRPTNESTAETGIRFNDIIEDESEPREPIKVIAEGLSIPWSIAFLPDESMLVTERPGTILHISVDGQQTRIAEVDGVDHYGEGGLLGITLHPAFSANQFVYVYFTSRVNGTVTNRVERYVYENDALSSKKVILEGIPGAVYHDGGRIAFGPDGMLYITVGDATVENRAQSTDSLAGKILRVTDEGAIPDDNPFRNEVWSLGHRNPQGITWDSDGILWSTEHGPSGAQTGNDELNRIERGANYGWPQIRGTQTADGLRSPVTESGTSDTWAPASALWWDSSVFFGGLRGEALYEAQIIDGQVTELKEHFKGEYGRIRDIVLGPDEYFYVTTSNTDGRGTPQDGDDKIIRIDPYIFR